ncbi:response regulator [Chromatium okenii]|uniref:response regulator n=1 Tax=Chromatium okenii TaxID=61644 RepID=UPI001906D1D0|nr:response regulator [Chromatium okenii]MBK1642483.1 response regulator [Chromatium okenii]
MLKILVVEDDFISRTILQEHLNQYGITHIAVNGKEAVAAIEAAATAGTPYDLVCLDVMMPEMSGQEALQQIRELEESRGIFSSQGIKVMMTTALDDVKSVRTAFHNLCDAYLIKPIRKDKLALELRNLKLIA